MTDAIQAFPAALWGILAEAGLWLLFGFAVAGLLHEWIPTRWLRSQLGRPGPASVVKGTLIGAPLPLCSCSVIPAAASLRRGGASKGASASFAVATPEIDVPAAGLTWALLGPVIAVARVVGAAVSAITAGLLIDAFDRREQERTAATDAVETSSSCHHEHHVPRLEDEPEPAHRPLNRPVLARLGRALRYGFVDLPIDLAFWLTIGLVLSAVVEVTLPASVLEGGGGAGALGILAAMGIGLVVYVCATGSTPLAAALVMKGLSPGAALAFLLAGPATNPATMAWVRQDLGKRALVIYVLAIGGVAFLAGLGMDLAAGTFALVPEAGAAAGHGVRASDLGGALLAALLTFALLRPRLDRWIGRRQASDVRPCCQQDHEKVGDTGSAQPAPADQPVPLGLSVQGQPLASPERGE
ncbi:MAG: SO_0444 family Cu/Zn efflux transporter [Planctomycetota bacterium]